MAMSLLCDSDAIAKSSRGFAVVMTPDLDCDVIAIAMR
jgi:hypothetical protein